MKLVGFIVIVFVIIGGIFLFSQNNAKSNPALTFTAVQADVAKGGQLIDVRTPAEYSAGHINGAINLSLQDIQAGTMPTVAKDQKIYLYCHSGNRSGQATSILKSAGYSGITDLGAISSVQALGGTITN